MSIIIGSDKHKLKQLLDKKCLMFPIIDLNDVIYKELSHGDHYASQINEIEELYFIPNSVYEDGWSHGKIIMSIFDHIKKELSNVYDDVINKLLTEFELAEFKSIYDLMDGVLKLEKDITMRIVVKHLENILSLLYDE